MLSTSRAPARESVAIPMFYPHLCERVQKLTFPARYCALGMDRMRRLVWHRQYVKLRSVLVTVFDRAIS